MQSARKRLRRVLLLSTLVVGLLAIPAGSASAQAPKCPSAAITSKDYAFIGPAGPRGPGIADMTGQVQPGDLITLQFTVRPTQTSLCSISLVSYTAPTGTYSFQNLQQQRVYQSNTGDVEGGDWMIQIRVPTCHFQVDFVGGAPITQFGPSSSNTYSGQNRLFDADFRGSEACGADDAPLPPGPGPQQGGIGG